MRTENIKMENTRLSSFWFGLALFGFVLMLPLVSYARDIEYADEEIGIWVTAGEPTQVQFPGVVAGGYKKSYSALSLEKKESDLIVFPNDKIDENGEAIVVRLKDGRTYSIRFRKSSDADPRDDVIKIRDKRGSIISNNEEDAPAYNEKNFEYAPPSVASGLMREVILAAEFGKDKIAGYQLSDQYRGETVLNDGAIQATIDRIYTGPNLWAYVIDVKNMLDVGQRLNPATFRLDGTIAVSFKRGELAPRPITTEQEIAGQEATKVYVITKAR